MADAVPYLDDVLDRLAAIERDVLRITRKAADEVPLKLVDIPDNITAPVIGRRNFQTHCLPLYTELVNLFADTDAVVAVHMDGDLKPLWKDIGACGITGIDSFSPQPDNDTSVSQARSMWPDMRLLVNFPSSVHLADEQTIHATAARILQDGAVDGKLWIQISEDPPPGRWKHSYPPIVRAVNAFAAHHGRRT